LTAELWADLSAQALGFLLEQKMAAQTDIRRADQLVSRWADRLEQLLEKNSVGQLVGPMAVHWELRMVGR